MTDTFLKCFCLNCGRPAVSELNISINNSIVDENGDFTGETVMGDCSNMIGTECEECGIIWSEYAMKTVVEFLGDNINEKG